MRWTIFIIFSYVLITVQTTVGRVLLERFSMTPDLLAPLAVFCALYARRSIDAVIAACVLGFALDLTTAGGSGSLFVVGPMPIAYAIATKVLFELREAFFRDRILTRMLLTLVFCLLTHTLYVTLESLLSHGVTSWSEYGRMLMQAVGISVYSAILAPALIWVFDKAQRWLVSAPVGRGGRGRR